ncbi:DMT family transporter [Rhizobium halophytocola]|uniref:Drug/metabolite transporter (DMT)-like permease n=1 Tax=Rhizobium halophytocola TaxID=735519 RepID=A0ABS4E3Z1_9HYPH|nr:DMT family transporter [Rhizobium halophytocola]MBP1852632.1 drug/metabolite transporter (DMT)-like permease [Rhizobium halophytocola]
MTRIQANLVLLLTAAIWGGGFVAQSSAMEHMGPHWFNAFRFAIAFIAVVPFAWREARRERARLSGQDLRAFILIGLSLFAGQSFQQVGIQTTTVTNASFLTGLYVVLVPFLSLIVWRRPPHWVVWPCAAMALIGILLLQGGTLSALNRGDLLVICCAASYAVQIALTAIAVQRSGRPLALTAIQFAICTFGALGFATAFESIDLPSISAVWLEILYAGLFSSGLAFALQIIGQRYTTAPQAAIFLSSESLFGALFGAILLGETLPVVGYVGCLLMFLAMLLVEIVPMLAPRRMAES